MVTLIFANWMLLTCSAGVLFWIGRSNTRLKGLPWIASAISMAALGLGMMLLRYAAPAWISNLAGALLIVAALALINRGLAGLVDCRARTWPIDLAVLGSLLAVSAYYTYRFDSMQHRLMAVSLAMAAETGIGCYVVATASSVRGVPRLPVLSCLGAFCGFNLARGLMTLDALGNDKLQIKVQTVGAAGQMIFSALLSLGSVWMATAELHDQLEGQARLDGLTGLLNRRALNQALAREIEQQRRTGAPLSALVLDLDHFKRINDSRGHPAGDAALCRVANILSEGVRARDVVARSGGEEFVIILPGQDGAAAFGTAERLRRQIAAERLEFEGAVVSLTASIGVAALSREGESAELLLQRADRALYLAKDRGRDRTETALEGSAPRGAHVPMPSRPGS